MMLSAASLQGKGAADRVEQTDELYASRIVMSAPRLKPKYDNDAASMRENQLRQVETS
jgi:hypothetical protein